MTLPRTIHDLRRIQPPPAPIPPDAAFSLKWALAEGLKTLVIVTIADDRGLTRDCRKSQGSRGSRVKNGCQQEVAFVRALSSSEDSSLDRPAAAEHPPTRDPSSCLLSQLVSTNETFGTCKTIGKKRVYSRTSRHCAGFHHQGVVDQDLPPQPSRRATNAAYTKLHELGALMTTHRKPSLYVMRLAAHQTVRTDTMPPSRCRHQAKIVGG